MLISLIQWWGSLSNNMMWWTGSKVFCKSINTAQTYCLLSSGLVNIFDNFNYCLDSWFFWKPHCFWYRISWSIRNCICIHFSMIFFALDSNEIGHQIEQNRIFLFPTICTKWYMFLFKLYFFQLELTLCKAE